MDKQLQLVQLRQLDATLNQWRQSRLPIRPKQGWVRSIRHALGMGSAALAKRLQVTDSAVRKFEESEAADAISLHTLRRIAEALDCELHYALVPRQSLEESIRKQATYVAHERIAALTQSMALEDQAVSETATAELLQREAEALAAGVRKRIW